LDSAAQNGQPGDAKAPFANALEINSLLGGCEAMRINRRWG